MREKMTKKLTQKEQKKLVGEAAAELVKDGMVLGIGTGSTVEPFIKKLGELGFKNLTAVATSDRSEKKAEEVGIEVLDFNGLDKPIDLAIDGADEVDSKFNLIKGGGGALTREKIIDYKAKKFVVIIDESKYVGRLGVKFKLPVEVVQFGWVHTMKALEKLCKKVSPRVEKSVLYTTDNNNFIMDCDFGGIDSPGKLEIILNRIPGVVENGIFRAKKVSEVWIGKEDGKVERRRK